MTQISWRKILCPVDFSEESKAGLRVAIDMCRRFGASLTLFHVHAREERHVSPQDPDCGDLEQLKQQVVKEGLAQVNTEEETGDPRLVISEHARRAGFDLVVMGTHGRTGRGRSLAGSVAESTARTSKCPVLVVHPDWNPQSAVVAAIAT